MHVLAAQQKDVVARFGKGRPRDPVARHEDVPVLVVVEDPADVPALEVRQVEVGAVREAPDALAGVVELSRPTCRHPGRIAGGRGGGGRGGRRHRLRLGPATRRNERRKHQNERGIDVTAHVAQYGARRPGRPGGR
jgi:hypothetical protein